MAKQYISKYGKVWRKKGGKETLGNALTLNAGETLLMYEQVPTPVTRKPAKPAKKEAPVPKTESFNYGGVN